MCQVRRASLAAQDQQVQLEGLDLWVHLASQAVPDLPACLEIQGPKVLQDFRVLRVPSAPLVQPVIHLSIYS